MHDGSGLHADQRRALMAEDASGQTIGLALGLFVGFGVLWLARSGQAPPSSLDQPAASAAAAWPAGERPIAPPRPKPKFPASLDMFVDANKRSGAGVSDGGDPTPKMHEGHMALVAPVHSPAAEQAAEDERAGAEAEPEVVEGEPDALPRAPEEPRSSLPLVLRLIGGTSVALAAAASVVGAGRSGRGLACSAAGAAALTAILGLAARAQGGGGEPAAWLGVAAFSGVVALSRLRGAK